MVRFVWSKGPRAEGGSRIRPCWPAPEHSRGQLDLLSISALCSGSQSLAEVVIQSGLVLVILDAAREVIGRGERWRRLFGGRTAKRLTAWQLTTLFDECVSTQYCRMASAFVTHMLPQISYHPCIVTIFSCSNLLRLFYTCCHRGMSGL